MQDMQEELLKIKNLSVSFDAPAGEIQAVRDVSFSLHRGEVLAIVGESGCGKSALCKSIMQLLPGDGHIKSGSIELGGKELLNMKEHEMRHLRGSKFAFVFQDPMSALNPTMTIGAQIGEAILCHERNLRGRALHERIIALMELVGIDRAEERCRLYPHNFSGGMRQRSVMAIALAARPSILLADEPTTALDVTIQAQILDLLRDLQKKLGTATILVSHDLGVVARVADRVAVMYAGRIVEIGRADEVFYAPKHPYTWGLLRALPALNRGREKLYNIPGMPPTLIEPPAGDAFAGRNEYALAIDYEEAPPMFQVSDTHFAATWLLDSRAPKIACPVQGETLLRENLAASPVQNEKKEAREVLLDVRNLSHSFRMGKRGIVRAVDGLSFQLRRGEILGLVGESGSGKSTVAKCVMGALKPDGGQIIYDGIDILDKRQLRANRARLAAVRQMIFQDSNSSLNPRMKVCDVIAEPLRIQRIAPPRGTLREEARFQMKYVGLDERYLERYPPELSGGQRQRVAIARALSMEPELLVADEPVAALDVSIQAQIINLFKHLQAEHGFSFLFIAHDLAMVEYLCDRVGVMLCGRLVEVAPTRELYANPLHPYTRALLSAMPVPDPRAERARASLRFDADDLAPDGALIEEAPDHFVLRSGKEA